VTSTIPNPQGTGAVPIIPVADAARHRNDHPTVEGPPAWLQLAVTIAAVAFGWFAVLQWRDPAAPLLMGAAFLIAVAAFTIDVHAAITVHRDTDEADV
jgi:hypothetical protein